MIDRRTCCFLRHLLFVRDIKQLREVRGCCTKSTCGSNAERMPRKNRGTEKMVVHCSRTTLRSQDAFLRECLRALNFTSLAWDYFPVRLGKISGRKVGRMVDQSHCGGWADAMYSCWRHNEYILHNEKLTRNVKYCNLFLVSCNGRSCRRSSLMVASYVKPGLETNVVSALIKLSLKLSRCTAEPVIWRHIYAIKGRAHHDPLKPQACRRLLQAWRSPCPVVA